MTVNEKIIQALEPFDIPITADFFGGGESEYFTFNPVEDRAVLYADNKPAASVVEMQIHYFLPADKNYLEIKKQIRRAIFEAGFTYPAIDSTVDGNGKIRHLIFECEIEDEYEMEE